MFARFGVADAKQNRLAYCKDAELASSPDAFVELNVVSFVGDLRALVQFRRASRLTLLLISGHLRQLQDTCIGRDIPGIFGGHAPPGSTLMTCAGNDILTLDVEDADGLTKISLNFCADSVPIEMRCNFWATWFQDKRDLTTGSKITGKFLVGELLVLALGRLIAIPFCAPDTGMSTQYIEAVQRIFPELGHVLPVPRENTTIYAIFPGLEELSLSPKDFKEFFDTDDHRLFLVNYNLMEVAVFQHHHYCTYVYPEFLEERVSVPEPYEIDWRNAVDRARDRF
jgi:hypothetical protein